MGGFVLCDNHLCDALTIVHHKLFTGEVHQNNPDFSAVVGIDGSRRIEHGDTFLQGQSATRPHLSLIAFGQGNKKPGGDEPPLKRFQHNGSFEVGPKIHTGALHRGISGQGLVPFVHNLNLNHRMPFN